jgi:uncharacterized lipoprotein YddW (UPF0748 family)
MHHYVLRFLTPTLVTTLIASSQVPPKREFRAAWVASVANLDWPALRTDPVTSQQAQLNALLDNLQHSGINAVIFQVRPECDALYPSTLEPWSYWLTGTQGSAPNPLWDPLEAAIREAHRRGMELHAWINPYRAEKSVGAYPVASGHVTVQHPDWILSFAEVRTATSYTPPLKILNPGIPAVRTHVARVVADIIRRYDVDGVHADDYFYPYPPQKITTQDDATYAVYNRGITDRGTWRRDNINLLMSEIADSIKGIKPFVKFGISPFGIWKDGVPAGTTGMDQYSTIYADPVAWLRQHSVDYLTPQLYWAIGGPQDFGTLLPWWADSTDAYGRHLYPGHAAYRMDPGSSNWPASEMTSQVRLVRRTPKAGGSVFFRAANGITDNLKTFGDSLRIDLYRTIALLPPMAWKDDVPPYMPRALRYAPHSAGGVALQWDPPLLQAGQDSAYRYVVYRFDHYPLPGETEDPRSIMALVGDRFCIPPTPLGSGPFYYVVTALDRVYNESDTSTIIVVSAPATPVLASPAPGATTTDSVVLAWLSPGVPSQYTVQVATDSLFRIGILVHDSTVADTFRVMRGMQGHAAYYWRVRVAGAGGATPYTETRMFVTGFPTVAQLSSPNHYQADVALTPSLRWHPVSDATSYGVQVSSMADFSAPAVDRSGITDTSTVVGPLEPFTIYSWHVRASNDYGSGPWSAAFKFRTVQTTEVGEERPTAYALSQNYPNPFNPRTVIEYEIPIAGRVLLKVYDVLGKEVASLVDDDMPAGRYTAAWTATTEASGVYFYRLIAGSYAATRRMLLLK